LARQLGHECFLLSFSLCRLFPAPFCFLPFAFFAFPLQPPILDKVVSLPREILNSKLDRLTLEKERLKEVRDTLKDSDHDAREIEIEVQEVMSLFSNLEEALIAHDQLEVQRLLKTLIKDVRGRLRPEGGHGRPGPRGAYPKERCRGLPVWEPPL